jgi:plasmid stability protein
VSDFLVRRVDRGLLTRLKRLAAEHHHSLQAEIQDILREATERVTLHEDVRTAFYRVRQDLAAKGPTANSQSRRERE